MGEEEHVEEIWDEKEKDRMKKTKQPYWTTTLYINEAEGTCEDLKQHKPRKKAKGKIMAWSEKNILVVNYPGYVGWTGGSAAISRKDKEEYVPAETVVYRLSGGGVFKDREVVIKRKVAQELTSFPTRKGLYGEEKGE